MKTRGDRTVERATDEQSVMRRLNRETVSVTVSYSQGDERVTRVGIGPTMAERVEDADSYLPPGAWRREVVSTPASIYADLVGRPRDAREGKRNNAQGMPVYPAFERKIARAAL